MHIMKRNSCLILACLICGLFFIMPVSAEPRSDLVFDLGGGIERDGPYHTPDIIANYYTRTSNANGGNWGGMGVIANDLNVYFSSDIKGGFTSYHLEPEKEKYNFQECSLGDECYYHPTENGYLQDGVLLFRINNYVVRIGENGYKPVDILSYGQKIANVLSGSSAGPTQTDPYHIIVTSYLKDPMYAAPSAFGKISDSSIIKALHQDTTGSAKILSNDMLTEIAWVEYLSSRELPPQGYGYDQNLFSKKKSLTEFMGDQAQDEASSAIVDTMLDLVENEVVEQSTKIIPISSLVNLYSTGMALSEYYRDNMLVTDFQEDLRNSYFSNRQNGKTPEESLSAARNDNSGVYSGYLEGLIRKGNSEAALIAALENQYAQYNWRELIKDNKANKYTKIAKITMKTKYNEAMNTILNAAQDIEKNQ